MRTSPGHMTGGGLRHHLGDPQLEQARAEKNTAVTTETESTSSQMGQG